MYLNGNSLGYKQNNSILTEITTTGTYSLKLEVFDIAENAGSAIVEFTVIDSTTSTSTSSGFTLIISVLIMISLSFSVRKVRKNE